MTAFYEHPEGTKETFYEIEYNVPPAGVVWDFYTGAWVQTEIYSRSHEKEEQYWESPVKGFNYREKRKIEKRKQESNPLFIDSELEAFREQEWKRRLSGFWFMNNGVPTYITGAHYMYLVWWRIDIGHPQFRMSDRAIFLEWSYCEGDPNSFGLIEAARRRSGKTYRSTVLMFEHISRVVAWDNLVGIQSKTKPDAAKIFSKLVNAFRALPDFFIPIYDTSAGSRPKSSLTFLEKSSRKGEDSDVDQLGGTINFESYELLAYDGMKLLRYLRDECLGEEVEVQMYPTGIKKAGEVVEGDLLVGNDGTPRMVLSSTPGLGDLYTVTKSNGESFTCTENHVLAVKFRDGDYGIMGLDEYLYLPAEKQKNIQLYSAGETLDFIISGATIGKFQSIQLDYNGLFRLADGTITSNCGKTVNANIFVGWGIIKPCLMVGTRTIVGKALYTTTIEEGGSAPFKLLWDDSGFLDKDKDTNRTRTGLYRTFVPAYKNDADFIDQYGICDEESSKAAMTLERQALSGNPRELAGYIRKNPFTIQEAFYTLNDQCIFDSMKINMQAEALSYKNESEWYVRGNLHWKDGIGSNVVFRENFNGLWKIHRGFFEANSKKDITNGWTRFGDRFKPTANNICITGADTFDHKLKNLSENSSPSNAAFYTYFRHDPFNEDLSDTFVCAYNHRQPTADLMAEDLLKQCVFFGSPAIIENNKPGAMSYFERNGYKDFIVEVDGKQGISGSTKNKQSMAEVTEAYISEHCHKVLFP